MTAAHRDFRIVVCGSICDADPARWNRLTGTAQPCLRHEFLAALERHGDAGAGSSWEPRHLLAMQGEHLVGALPLYLKHDSWGEFVFDFAWAQAYARAGLDYYPKLVSAVPFTPVTGSRFLVAPGGDRAALARCLLAGAQDVAVAENASSLHVLFPGDEDLALLTDNGLSLRMDCQFHWRDSGYADFDAFLDTLTARRRKKIRRERRRVAEAGITFRHFTGATLGQADWDNVYRFHAATFLRRGRPPYLPQKFFDEIGIDLSENLLVIQAMRDGSAVAAAIFLRDDSTLYGRYWGCLADYHSLHFETCYYQGIAHCLANGLCRFEPGTQGEHKLTRGFTPTATWSAHWIAHAQFARAIDDYLAREREAVDGYIAEQTGDCRSAVTQGHTDEPRCLAVP